MAYYKPLQGISGVQTDFNRFLFSWNSAGNDYQAHYLWIYKEDEIDAPQMWKYSQCIDNRIQAAFQYNTVPMKEIRMIKFLIFISDEQRAPSREDLYRMSQTREFVCAVCCGSGDISWRWIPEKTSVGLVISSDKKIPEGVLYYEYPYGNRLFRFDIPGEINYGDNYYGNIYFPELTGLPQLKSREQNVHLTMGNGKGAGKKPQGNTENGGFFKKITNLIRH